MNEKSTNDYIIITTFNLAAMQRVINEFIKKEYSLVGTIQMSTNGVDVQFYFQSMIKNELRDRVKAV